MSDEAKKPSGPDWKVNPELFDDYDIREERKPTPESEAYYQSLMAMMPTKKGKAADNPPAE